MTAGAVVAEPVAGGEWRPPSAQERLRILNQTRTIAVVGASSNPARPSYFVATYLLSSSTDYTVWFVNPRETSILGHPVYPTLADLPEPPDLVDVFRRAADLPEVASDCGHGRGAARSGLSSGCATSRLPISPHGPGCRLS